MAKTQRNYYLDDEVISFINDLRSRGLASNKSQAARRALKAGIEYAKAHGLDSLPTDKVRKYPNLQRGMDPGSDKDNDTSVEGDAGGSPSDRRPVPDRANGSATVGDQQDTEDAAPDRAEAGDAGDNSLLSRFNLTG